jgi:hypothetical protein
MTETLSTRSAIVQSGLESLRPLGMREILRRGHVHTLRELVAKAEESRRLPSRLQFRLRNFMEHESTDDFLQGASDEVFLSAIGTDSAAVVLDENGRAVLEAVTAPRIGDISDDRVRGPWSNDPFVLVEFDLRRPSDWPRSFVVTLLFVELDNENLVPTFDKLEREVGGKIKSTVVQAASAAAGAIAGAVVGSVVPGIGTLVGAAVGGLAGGAYDFILSEIKAGLKNDVFTPRPIELLASDPSELRRHPGIQSTQRLDISEMGARYTLEYDWVLAG